MHDAASRRHPVDLAGPDCQLGAEAVAVHDLAVEQIGHRREPDMGMRSDIESGAGAEFGRAEVIEKDEWPDHARTRRRQGAAHGEAVAEVDRAWHHDMGDGVAAIGVARLRVLAGEKAHGLLRVDGSRTRSRWHSSPMTAAG